MVSIILLSDKTSNDDIFWIAYYDLIVQIANNILIMKPIISHSMDKSETSDESLWQLVSVSGGGQHTT